MSFFKDFKDDLSLAVNELLPGEDLENEDELDESSDMMVNTLEGELDIESELSKLDGLLEHVDAPEDARHVQIEPEEPVLEKLKAPEPDQAPMPKPRAAKPQAAPKPRPVAKEKPKKEDSVDARPGRPNSAPERGKDSVDEFRFPFEALAEDMEPEPRPRLRPHQQPVSEPAARSTFRNNRSMQTSTTIKEEVPMNEDLMKETTMAIDDELTADTPEITDEVSIITTGTTIKGNLATTGSFSISGRVEGNVQCNGKLEVTGTIRGNSSSSEVFSDAAKIEGEIMSTGTVKIGLGSVVVGNISATSAVIAGAVKGDIDVQGPVVVDTSAVIVGNIKSRSVQINNGAVIEGFCSQCYADIDVESLFGDGKKGK